MRSINFIFGIWIYNNIVVLYAKFHGNRMSCNAVKRTQSENSECFACRLYWVYASRAAARHTHSTHLHCPCSLLCLLITLVCAAAISRCEVKEANQWKVAKNCKREKNKNAKVDEDEAFCILTK